MKYTYLSSEDEKAFFRALSACWDAVADDILGHDETQTVPRSTVIEIALDQFAQRNSEFLHMPSEQYKRTRDWMLSIPNHILQKVVKKEFRFTRYGY